MESGWAPLLFLERERDVTRLELSVKRNVSRGFFVDVTCRSTEAQTVGPFTTVSFVKPTHASGILIVAPAFQSA
jgi:hypothetical protein